MTSAFVHLSQDHKQLEPDALRRERTWLFNHVFPGALAPIREGLQECAQLLTDAQITLPLTSREMESLKGVMTRQGTRLTKIVLMLKLNKLQFRTKLAHDRDVHLQQIEDVKTLIHYSMESLEHELFEDTAKRVVDDLMLNLVQASEALTKQGYNSMFPLRCVDNDLFQPELPETLALDLYIQDASLIAELRVVQQRGAENLFNALRRSGQSATGGFVRFRGTDVKVLEHIRVESQDPALIAISTKLTALKHAVEQIQKKLKATQWR